MIKYVLVWMICIVALSACDAGASTSPNNTINADTFSPIDLENTTITASGMVMSGAIDRNTGEVSSFSLPFDIGQRAYRNLEVDAGDGYLLRFVHRTGLEAGTYPITVMLGEIPADTEIAGGLLYLWSPDPAEQFTVNPQGTITLDFTDQDTFATYELTVENPAGESVEIVGQLYAEEGVSAAE